MTKIKPKITVVPLLEKSYLVVIKNSVGSNQFRNFFALVNNKEEDILRNGEISCAFYVSSILRVFSFIKETHATVSGTVKDLCKSGWKETKTPKTGDVLIWNGIKYPDGETHTHIGFYIGSHQAISHSTTAGTPIIHHYTFDNSRKIFTIYHYPWSTRFLHGTKT